MNGCEWKKPYCPVDNVCKEEGKEKEERERKKGLVDNRIEMVRNVDNYVEIGDFSYGKRPD